MSPSALADSAKREQETEEALRRAARSGSPAARFALGRHLLTHSTHLMEGVDLIASAAPEVGQASHLLALLTATGLGCEQSWTGALELSRHAAALGYELAQAELALLGATNTQPVSHQTGVLESETAAEPGELSRWLDIPTIEVASRSPRIAVVRQFASVALCDWLIARARARIEPAQIFDKLSGNLRPDPGRTNSETQFRLVDSDLPMLLTRARIASVTELPISGFELTTVLHYAPGQRYAPHLDSFETSSPGYSREVATKGQRVVTFLLYLNDDYEGGETEFSALKARFRGNQGDALFFWNIDASGKADRQTLHAGLSPTRGEKWLLSQWIRALPRHR